MAKISKVMVGKSLVGEGNEVAHVDLLIGPRGSPVETAFCNALTNNKDGFTTIAGGDCAKSALQAKHRALQQGHYQGCETGRADVRTRAVCSGESRSGQCRRRDYSCQRGGRRVHLRRCFHPLGGRRRRQDPAIQLPGHEGSNSARGRGQADCCRSHRTAGFGEASVQRRGILDKRQPRTGKTLCRAGWSVAPVEKAPGSLEHDPEKCVAVFGKDYAKIKELEHGDDFRKVIVL